MVSANRRLRVFFDTWQRALQMVYDDLVHGNAVGWRLRSEIPGIRFGSGPLEAPHLPTAGIRHATIITDANQACGACVGSGDRHHFATPHLFTHWATILRKNT